MYTTAVGMASGVELLELARCVEQSVPSDLAHARACLQALDDTIRQHEQAAVGWSGGSSDPEAAAGRLPFVLARGAQDLRGGHMLGVTGLDREVKRYLAQTRR